MRISLIVAYYKDLHALKLIIDSVRQQDYKNFELMVAEDNNDPEVRDYLSSIRDIDIVHTAQEDLGIRKARSQNNAIIQSTGDYLIFIDADCIPCTSFITSHAKLAEKGHVLSGRRVNLGPRISRLIRSGSLKSSTLSSYYLLFSPLLWLDGATHIGQGVRLPPDNWLYKKYFSKRKSSNTNILGCNFSCFKDDIKAIDGFDESYGESAIPDDTDIQWRLETVGLRMKSCKLSANVLHLHHNQIHRVSTEEAEILLARMQSRKASGNYIAQSGLSTHTK